MQNFQKLISLLLFILFSVSAHSQSVNTQRDPSTDPDNRGTKYIVDFFKNASNFIKGNKSDKKVEKNTKSDDFSEVENTQYKIDETIISARMNNNIPGIKEYYKAEDLKNYFAIQEKYDLYKKSEKKGNPFASLMMARIISERFILPYYTNEFTFVDNMKKRACKNIKKNYKEDELELDLVELYYDKCYLDEEREVFRKKLLNKFSKYNKYPHIQYLISRLLNSTRYNKDNYNESKKWLEKAAINGSYEAACNLLINKKLWNKLNQDLKTDFDGNKIIYNSLKQICNEPKLNNFIKIAAQEIILNDDIYNKEYDSLKDGNLDFSSELNGDEESLCNISNSYDYEEIKKAKKLVEKYKNDRVSFIIKYLK